MKENTILQSHICGYYTCTLNEEPIIDSMSDSFMEMIGYTMDELMRIHGGSLVALIHQEDKEVYRKFMDGFRNGNTKGRTYFRLISKNGDEHTVYNDMSICEEDGQIKGYCVALEDDFMVHSSYGILIMTDEEFPKILSINDKMKEILHYEDSDARTIKLVQSNVFFMVPDSEREYVTETLQCAGQEPALIESRIIRLDNTETYLVGWLFKRARSNENFLFFACIEEKSRMEKFREENIGVQSSILKNLFLNVFAINYDDRTVKCIKCTTKRYVNNSWTIDGAGDILLSMCMDDDLRDQINYWKTAAAVEKETKGEVDVADVSFRLEGRNGHITYCNGIYISKKNGIAYLCFNENGQKIDRGDNSEVFIRCFGYFDVFKNGSPLYFRYSKTKELLAVLVDRRGGFLNADEAISYLWPEESANTTTRARYRKVLMRLTDTLNEEGIGYILEKSGGSRRIIPEKVDCDFFDYMKDINQLGVKYDGPYISNYSWSEYSSNIL